jgi:hypothetical protein
MIERRTSDGVNAHADHPAKQKITGEAGRPRTRDFLG